MSWFFQPRYCPASSGNLLIFSAVTSLIFITSASSTLSSASELELDELPSSPSSSSSSDWDVDALASDSSSTLGSNLGRLAERRAGGELLAYPNSGERYEAETKTWSEERSSGDLPDLAAGWRARGARLIGGCCRVTAPDLTRLAAALGRA